MSRNNFVADLIDAAPNRRSFVRKLGVASAALGVAGSTGLAQSTAPAITDVDILNFALNLEYLEAEFYTVATTGTTIPASLGITGSGSPGVTTGGAKVPFTDNTTMAVAMELAHDEQTHVSVLRSAITGLGGTPVAKPAINLNALGIGFASQSAFLTVARALEDVGVTAYGGAAPLISNKAILGYAARILAVEAFHSGNIRLLVAQDAIQTTALDGVDHLPPPSGMLYFNTNAAALSEVRSPGEVLFLAYGGVANAASGGFYPNGVNGKINTSSAVAASSNSDAILTATPNPIPVTSGALGSTTLTFNAPSSKIAIYVGGIGGYLIYSGAGTGSLATGPILGNGSVITLQDLTAPAPYSPAATLAAVTISLQSS